MTTDSDTPPLVSASEWRRARNDLLVKEKALTRAADALAAERRQLPRYAVGNDYRFTTLSGEISLLDLFAGRRQLIVYHHMLKPQDSAPCSGCGMVGDHVPPLAHLHARNTSLAFVSEAPINEIEAFRQRMGWVFPWVETRSSFNRDHDIDGGFGINVFLAEGGEVYRCWHTTGRGVEMLGSVWSFLDVTPLGRQETWERSPASVVQTPPYQWWRLHDNYES